MLDIYLLYERVVLISIELIMYNELNPQSQRSTQINATCNLQEMTFCCCKLTLIIQANHFWQLIQKNLRVNITNEKKAVSSQKYAM